MPDQSSAASEHALIQEITAPLARLPDDAMPIVADVDFPVVLRGYDRLAVDAYVKKTSQLVAELQATRSPEAAVRRALERVGEQISGILQRAHDTAEQITIQSRSDAEDRLEVARQEAAEIRTAAEQRVRDLDVDTDRIWSERHRIVDDARELAGQLLALAESAAERFPAAEEASPPEREVGARAVADFELDEFEPVPEGSVPPPPPSPASTPPPSPASAPPPRGAERDMEPMFEPPPEFEDPDVTEVLPHLRREQDPPDSPAS